MQLILDRIETLENGKRIAVFELPDESFTNIHEDDMPEGMMDEFVDGIILDAVYENGKIVSAELLFEETEKKKQEMKERLNRLFNRNKRAK
jgi:hypothetical protein